MSYYRICPLCGDHLDPGEVCACTKKTAADAANTDDGSADPEGTKTNESTPNCRVEAGGCQG